MRTSAFPVHGSMGEVVQEGMTLRDYFAAKAMQGIIARLDGAAAEVRLTFIGKPLCEDAYAIADAMLKARDE